MIWWVKKHEKVCRSLNFLICISAFSASVSTSAFALLVGVSVGIASSAVT